MTLLRLAEFGTISHEDLLSCLDFSSTQLYTNGDPLFVTAPGCQWPRQGGSDGLSKIQTWDGSACEYMNMAEGPRKPSANVRMFTCLQPVGIGLCRLTQQLRAAHRYARARFCRTAFFQGLG